MHLGPDSEHRIFPALYKHYSCSFSGACADLTSRSYFFFSNSFTFTYLLVFLLPFDVFRKQVNAMQKLCQCNVCPARSGRWQKLSGIQRWGRSANKSSHARLFQKHSQMQGQRDQNSSEQSKCSMLSTAARHKGYACELSPISTD